MLNETSAWTIVLSCLAICITVITVTVEHNDTVIAQEAVKNGLQQCSIDVGKIGHQVVWQKDCNK